MSVDLCCGALVSVFTNWLCESAASWVKCFFERNNKEVIRKLVEDLKTKKSSADLLLSSVEEKLVTEGKVRQWLDDLKDNIYHANDLLYMIETDSFRRKETNEALRYFFSSTSDNQITMLEETLRKLNNCLETEGPHREHLNRMNPERDYPPLLEEDEVHGRNANKEEIIESLLQDDVTNGGCSFFVISLVGMGGIGKTTFAEFVYNDERIHSRFNCKVWITVGDDKLDCSKVMKSIVEKVTSQPCQSNELRDLQHKVKKTLIGKKFLFVLDDVWDDNRRKWDLLSHSFRSGLSGSKIIVTTRSYKVARIMTPGSVYKLKVLSEIDGLQLFVEQAHVDFNKHLYLQNIAKEIVDKCKGLPLAIKSIGCLLRGNHAKEEWSKILNSPIWQLYKSERDHILPALWLSYLYLPSQVKQCFAYCSIFPKDHEFVKRDMILLWMAEGYLHSDNEKSTEEVGEEYFDNLISKSFFQSSTDYREYFLMHDLIHDLAIFISSEFCVTKYDKVCSLKKARHVRYGQRCEEDVQLMNFENLSNAGCFLRTLLLELDTSRWLSHELEQKRLRWLSKIEELHQSFPRLRVLSIGTLSEFPASISTLKYLKYLKLDSYQFKKIPNTVCSLYNLETLLLEGCRGVTQLPSDIGNLEKLRHLSVPYSLKEMPWQFCKLRNLQTLNRFVVGKRKDCGGIELLKNVPDLHGHLKIVGLENVNSLDEDSHAILKSTKFLSSLFLEWARNHEADDSKEREILGALEPHPNLKKLHIRGYEGTSFPSWLGDPLTSIETLELKDCPNCSFLPSFGKLFGSLESLRIRDVEEIQEWSFIEGGVFCLKQISFWGCRKLEVSLFSYHFPSLRKLTIDGCKQLLAPSGQPMHSPFPSLEILEIRNCEGEEFRGFPWSLKNISISYCKDLKYFHEGAFQRLTSLEKLSIKFCPKLRCLPKELPTSLSHLYVYGCDLLTTRLQRETGEDWPVIAHIPNITVNDKEEELNRRLLRAFALPRRWRK